MNYSSFIYTRRCQEFYQLPEERVHKVQTPLYQTTQSQTTALLKNLSLRTKLQFILVSYFSDQRRKNTNVWCIVSSSGTSKGQAPPDYWPLWCRHLQTEPRRVCRGWCHRLSDPSWPGSCLWWHHWSADGEDLGLELTTRPELTFSLLYSEIGITRMSSGHHDVERELNWTLNTHWPTSASTVQRWQNRCWTTSLPLKSSQVRT